MKILITIPHYYDASSDSSHGSGNKDPRPRIQALCMGLFNIYSLFSSSQYMIDIQHKQANRVNNNFTHNMNVVICTTDEKHLLEHINVPENFYKHHQTPLENPKLLGFECQKILRENLGKYDYYCFMEDDLIINDPLFFEKINWFNKNNENINLLQPNRYEISTRGRVLKTYIDGDIRAGATENYQNINEFPHLNSKFMNQNIIFQRSSNPHSGCYFLTQKQMEHWATQLYFLDMDTSFISPLESSATLGIMKTFKVYKPSPKNANFFEIQHFGDMFLRLIGNQVSLVNSEIK